MSLEPNERLAVLWICSQCKKKTKGVLSSRFVVPLCVHCMDKGNKYRCHEAIMADTLEEAAQIAPLSKEKNISPRDNMFEVLCAVLDKDRVLMGGGGHSEHFCVVCERQPHGPMVPEARKCTCPCHEAWEIRREVERRAA